LFQNRQQAQFLETGNLSFYKSHRQAKLPALLEKIGPKPANPGDKVGKIDLPLFLKAFPGVFGNNVLDDLVDPFLGRLRRFNGEELTMNSEDDRSADFKMHIRGPAFDGGLQNSIKEFHAWSLSTRREVS